MKNFYIRSLVVLLCYLLPSGAVFAQETSGGLQGRVIDARGEPLTGATVIAIHDPSGTQYATATSSDGRFNLPGLRVGGPYSIKASYIGYGATVKMVQQVSLGQPQTLNFVLTNDGRTLSEVVIKTARSGVRVNAYGAGQNIPRTQITNTPTISRSIQDLTRLVPQASKDNSFLGSSFRQNNISVDGAINNDAIGFSPSLGGITGTSGQPGSSTRSNPISLDAIEDIQVYLAPYDVKIGNFTGASVNAVTKAGTNKVVGSVYAYGRNAFLTGPNHAGDGRKLPGDFHDYQTGVRVGFPIIKNKLFWFTNVEIARRVDPIQQEAGSSGSQGVITLADAQKIQQATIDRYGFSPGTYGQYNVYARSNKFFNRLDWNIDGRNQLTVRNNTIFSQAVNMERDEQDFRFGSIAYQQKNNQTSTVAELKTRFNNQLSNSLIAGYTSIHDFRNPFPVNAINDPGKTYLVPQVQIVGETPGSTIFFGTDREAAIFDQKQHTIEITDNLTWNLGKHTLLFGTHNELYNITYGFVNSWNGRVDYLSIADYLANRPYRVRGSYNFVDDSRDYILHHPSAQFNVNFYSAYAQDKIQISERFSVTPGLRIDYSDVPKKQEIDPNIRNAYVDPYYGTTYTYTLPRNITNDYLGRIQASPRIGFRFDAKGDGSLVLRGGTGLFTGRIPLAWLGYAFYNTGTKYGGYDQRAFGGSGTTPFVSGTDPLKLSANGISNFIGQQGATDLHNPNDGKTQVDLVDNKFSMPKVWRTSFAVDFTDANKIKYSVEGVFTKTLKDVVFKQVKQIDAPSYYIYDSAANLRRQPIFGANTSIGGDLNNARFSNIYEMSNTDQGYRFSLTAQINKTFAWGLSFSTAYTYGMSTDVSNGVRNSMESNFQLNQALNPNSPGPAYSNFDLRHRIIANLNYRLAWNRVWVTNIGVFFSSQSGSPFTYGFVNYTPQGTPQQVALAYIPNRDEAKNFFVDNFRDANGQVYQSAASAPPKAVAVSRDQQAAEFNSFIDRTPYLNSRRGKFTERNVARTPWNTQADLHFEQEIHFIKDKDQQYLTISLDIINLTNLLYRKWGWVYFSPNTYNSTASVGLQPYFPNIPSVDYPNYTFRDPGKPYSIDFFNSRYQMQLGVRYSF